MLSSENIKVINRIEKSFPVDQWRIDGIHVWPLVRLSILNELEDQKYRVKTEKKNLLILLLKKFLSLMILYKNKILDCRQNQKVKQSDIFIFTNTSLRVLLKNKYYDRIFDPYIELLNSNNITSFVFEYNPQIFTRIPRYGKSFLMNHIIIFFFLYFKFLIIKYTKSKSVNLNDYEKFIDYLKDQNLSINFDKYNKNQIIILFWKVRVLSIFFKHKIAKVKPKYAMTECFYNTTGLAFNIACSELRIPSIDVQHGIAGFKHRAYGFWENVPESGYEMLPDFYFCWDKTDAGAINKWSKGLEKHKPIITGNLWNNMWLEGENNLIRHYDNKLKKNKKSDAVYKNILYTFGPSFFEEYTEQFQNLIKKTSNECFWFLRLHPSQLGEINKIKQIFLKDTKIKNCEIVLSSTLPLPSLLTRIDLHITRWSAAVYDALDFGVKTLVIDIKGKHYYQKEIDSGTVIYSPLTDDLNWIFRMKNKRKQFSKKIENKTNVIDFFRF